MYSQWFEAVEASYLSTIWLKSLHLKEIADYNDKEQITGIISGQNRLQYTANKIRLTKIPKPHDSSNKMNFGTHAQREKLFLVQELSTCGFEELRSCSLAISFPSLSSLFFLPSSRLKVQPEKSDSANKDVGVTLWNASGTCFTLRLICNKERDQLWGT